MKWRGGGERAVLCGVSTEYGVEYAVVCTVLYTLYSNVLYTHSSLLFSTLLYSTLLYSTLLYSTLLYSTDLRHTGRGFFFFFFFFSVFVCKQGRRGEERGCPSQIRDPRSRSRPRSRVQGNTNCVRPPFLFSYPTLSFFLFIFIFILFSIPFCSHTVLRTFLSIITPFRPFR